MTNFVVHLRVGSDADVSRSSLAAARFAQEIGFSPRDCQVIARSASELTRSVIRCAGGGEIVIENAGFGEKAGIQISAWDRGPVIKDTDRAILEVQRSMDDFEIHAAPGKGTRIVVRKWLEG